MKLSEFDYHLPKNHIAQYPLSERDSSRLMVLRRANSSIEHRVFRDVIDYFRYGDVFILNDTKVIPVRLYGEKSSGGKVEILLIKELKPDRWEVLVKGLRHGKVIFKNGASGYVSRPESSQSGNNGAVTFTSDSNIKKIIEEIGVMPLPPYIKRPATQSDANQYQTVYAEQEGAIAAPTAGLHFTAGLLEKIKEKGVEVKKLTLHIGYGTFKPVLSQEVEKHKMDEEYYEIPEDTASAVNSAKSDKRRVIAVGTTVTRALESSASENYPSPIPLPQGEGARGRVKAGAGKASIFIYPGYRFKVIDVLITNFHLPKSTPLMLTSAFSGIGFLKKAYLEAADKGYRFFSYGDAMLII
jgi:S-adenosylmethionine:tRNA ribosyltransferase-isomerase